MDKSKTQFFYTPKAPLFFKAPRPLESDFSNYINEYFFIRNDKP